MHVTHPYYWLACLTRLYYIYHVLQDMVEVFNKSNQMKVINISLSIYGQVKMN